MGSKNSKEKEKDPGFTGPMGIMHDKYGSAATHQCQKWIKLGFPEKGTFSLNQIEKLKALLRAHKVKNNNKHQWNPDWTAVALWQKETLSRQVKQAKGEIKINTAGSPPGNSVLSPVTSVCQPSSSLYPDLQQLASIHKVNMDLECPVCPPAYVPQPQAAASAPRLQAADSTSEQRERTDSWPSSINSIREHGKLFLCNWTIANAFQPNTDQEHGEGEHPRDGKHVSRLACEQHRRLKDLLVYALHCEELELAKEKMESKKLRLAQLQAYQGNQGDSSGRREAVEEVKGVEAGNRGRDRVILPPSVGFLY